MTRAAELLRLKDGLKLAVRAALPRQLGAAELLRLKDGLKLVVTQVLRAEQTRLLSYSD